MHKKEYLITVNGDEKLRVALIEIEFNTQEYTINRYTWQYGKKITTQPQQKGYTGFSGRSIIQQAELEFKSKIEYYLNRGYKLLSKLTRKNYNNLSKEDLYNLYGDIKFDENNLPKPMMPKSFNNCSTKLLDKKQYACPKLNGIRCLIYYENNQIKSSLNYTESLNNILNNNKLKNFFKKNPTIILDGEIYNHGFSYNYLLKILEENKNNNILEYHIYDYISEETFENRYINLLNWKSEINNDFIKIINHYLVKDWTIIERKHNEFIKQGYEGLILRNPNKKYGRGLKSSLYMIEMTLFKSKIFKIIGYGKGLKPEDMYFTCENIFGKTFKTKLINNPKIREIYINNFNKLINTYGTINYIESNNNIPIDPIFKSFNNFL